MMTFEAFFMMNAASSAFPLRTVRSAAPAGPAAAPPVSVPQPPNNTLMMLRFMPLHIMYDRIAPDAPTRAPVIISARFWIVNPIPQAAQPE